MARAHAEQALGLARQIVGNVLGEVFSRYHLALGLVEQDELDESARLLERARQRGSSATGAPPAPCSCGWCATHWVPCNAPRDVPRPSA